MDKKRYLATHKINGRFYFTSNLIEINKYNVSFKEKIEKVLFYDITNKNIILREDELEILSIFYHEITHFLDLTTTTWGIEYIARKIFFILGRTKSSLDVFKLNVAEIDMHDTLIEILNPHTDIKLLDCLFQHHLVYDESHGSLVMVDFSYNNERLYAIPFSMLSVLEASAFSSEVLIKIQNIEKLESEVEKTISLKILENECNDTFNDIKFSEYNLVLILAKRHFSDLSLKELLTFVKVLIGFALNLGSMNVSMLSTFLKQTFIENRIGNAIIKDMQRGMSRHIIVFKFILLMYEYLEHEQTNKEELIKVLKASPIDFIQNFIDFYKIPYEAFFENDKKINEFYVILNSLKEQEKIFDMDVVLNSSIYNKEIIESSANTLVNLSDLKLLDIFLEDGTVITMPNRLDIDIEDFFDKNMDKFLMVENTFKKTDMYKFHIHPDDVTHV